MIWVRTSRVRTQTIHIILPNIKKIACSKDPQPCRNTLIASLSGECPGYSLHWSCHNSRLWYLEGSLEPGTKLPSMQGIPRMVCWTGKMFDSWYYMQISVVNARIYWIMKSWPSLVLGKISSQANIYLNITQRIHIFLHHSSPYQGSL